MTQEKSTKCEFQIDGMHCPACEVVIADKVSQIKDVKNVVASVKNNTLTLESTECSDDLKKTINDLITPHGYKIHEQSKSGEKSDIIDWLVSFVVTSFIVLIFIILQRMGISNLFNPDRMNLTGVFIIGVIASLSSCMAVVGGVVLTLSANAAKTKNSLPIVVFYVARLVSFFVLGGIIGLIGKSFTLNATANFVLSLILFVAMVLNGLALLGVFKKLSLSFPTFVVKMIPNVVKKTSWITPILLGTLTFFLPCGFTQSMQIYTLSSREFLSGGLTMFTFALGTLPVLALVSFTSMKLNNHKYAGVFYKTAGFLIIMFGLMNLYGGLVSFGIIRPF